MVRKKIIGIILAAGKGKRMRSQVPKVLHHVAGLPMILLVIDTLRKAGIKEIFVVIAHPPVPRSPTLQSTPARVQSVRRAGSGDGALRRAGGGEKVQNVLPDNIRVVEQGEPLGTGHAVSCVKKLLSGFSGDILVASGDMPLVKPNTVRGLILRHQRNGASCTLLTGRLNQLQGYGRILRDTEGNVVSIAEDSDINRRGKKITEVNSGMYCFSSKELFRVLPLLNRRNRQKEFYLTDAIGLLVKRGCKVDAFTVKDEREIIGVNSRKDLSVVNGIINQWIIEGHMKRGVTIVDPGSTYIDIRTKVGRDTVINPFTVIEGKVTIGRGCVIGPFTHLRDKTVVKDEAEIGNFVEVKKSTVGKHTKAKHLAYLGDATLGKFVNIGAGTITANYDGKHKYPSVIKDKAFIGTHTTLVAPVVIGKGAVTGAGSVVLRGRDVPPNTIVVGVPARVLKKMTNDKAQMTRK